MAINLGMGMFGTFFGGKSGRERMEREISRIYFTNREHVARRLLLLGSSFALSGFAVVTARWRARRLVYFGNFSFILYINGRRGDYEMGDMRQDKFN